MKVKKIFKNKLLCGSEALSHFCLTEPQPAEDPRDSQYLRAHSASSLPPGGARQCSKCWVCTSQQLAMHTRQDSIQWLEYLLFFMYINHVGLCVCMPVDPHIGALRHVYACQFSANVNVPWKCYHVETLRTVCPASLLNIL